MFSPTLFNPKISLLLRCGIPTVPVANSGRTACQTTPKLPQCICNSHNKILINSFYVIITLTTFYILILTILPPAIVIPCSTPLLLPHQCYVVPALCSINTLTCLCPCSVTFWTSYHITHPRHKHPCPVHTTTITNLIFIFNDNTQDMGIARITQSSDEASNWTRQESWFNSWHGKEIFYTSYEAHSPPYFNRYQGLFPVC